MLKILLPVDFSEGTFKACQYALRLCSSETGTQLLLIHCFQDYLADADTDTAPPLDQTPSAAVAEGIIHRNETEAFEQLEALFNRLQQQTLENQNIYLERKIIHGSPEDCIPEQVKQFGADLLVMHTDGRSGLARSVFGTITTKMVDTVNIPVLTVPEQFKGNGINRVLYATDFDKADISAIQQLQRLLQPVSPSVVCAHISDGELTKDETRLQQLQQEIQSIPGRPVQFALLTGDDVAESLLQFVQDEHVDLVSLASREHSTWANLFNQSLAKKLVLESQIPLLVFQGQGEMGS